MFYKPKFCCDCGEKIERVDWKPWSSRRFCQLCETEQKAHELLPRVVVVLGCLLGVVGFGTYLRQGASEPAAQSIVNPAKRRLVTETSQRPAEAEPNVQVPANSVAYKKEELSGQTRSSDNESEKQLKNKKNTSDEPVYFCGAMTKKGTPCSRRVKFKGRCWQHGGKTAAIKTEKTIVGN